MINNYILNHTIIMKIKYLKNLVLFIPLIILNIISLLNMVNSRLISDIYKNAFYKQLIWFMIGYLIIIIVKKFKFKKIFYYAKYLYIFSNILLLLVLFFGSNVNGAKCWFNIFGISFQPSELTKLSMSLYMSYIISNTKHHNFREELFLIIKLFIIFLIPSILVFLEPDTGAIISFFIIFIVCLCSSKLNKWWYLSFILFLVIIISSFILLYIFKQDFLINLIGTSLFYRMDRIFNFINNNSYQLENALITIGSTSIFKFNLNSIILYIPEAPTDFIFAFSCGNYGIFSGLLIIGSYLLIDIYLISKSYKLKDYYQIFINTYLGIFLFNQIYNIFMNVGLLPIMGIPLPFLSYGGTNTLINYLYLSIILAKEKTT